MTDTNIYRDIAVRTDSAFMLGVVGPVRTGKSTFIKRFMETLVIPQIENAYMRERARDELPQSGSGRMIMTAEPKFVPEDAVTIAVDPETTLSVRLVDCVGYMVDGAAGQYEDGAERMVTTPWFDHEVSLTDAAEKGTHKVIAEHSTIGIVVTTDGSICDIPRENYLDAEKRVIQELKSIGKPFVVLLNCVDPDTDTARQIASSLEESYGVTCLRVNCQTLSETDVSEIMRSVLREFPLKAVGIYLPEWLEALDNATIGGSTRIYAGQTDEIHIYPKPDEAKEQFDIFKAKITCSNPKVLDVQPGKRDSYAYGYVILTGKKTGTATVTVTEPESGVSCSFKVVVMPRFLSVLENALAFLMSLPGRILGTIYGHI